MRQLLRNAYIVLEQKRQDIAVVDGRFEYAPNLPEAAYDKIIDLEGRMVLRGFCELHTHLDKALVAQNLENRSGTLEEAISIMGRYKEGMTQQDICARAVQTLKMCRQHGTRHVRTHVDVDAAAGLRSVLALQEAAQLFDGVSLEIVAFPQEGLVGKPQNLLALDAALSAGADLVGGIPANESDPAAHIEMVFDLAEKHNVDVDMHIDETDDPESMTLELLAEAAIKRGWQQRTFAGHCCSLAANPPAAISAVLEKVRAAGIRVISLPSTNLYLQGRGDAYNIRRGIAPIRRLAVEYGIPVALGCDNIQDPFNPFGSGSLLQTALIAAHGCHMGGADDLELLFQMISKTPMEMCGIPWQMTPGEEADFIVLDAVSPRDAIIGQAGVYARFRNDVCSIWGSGE